MSCGTCKHYEPTRNPETGRVLRSERGHCRYPVKWPELPAAYSFNPLGARPSVNWPMVAMVWAECDLRCALHESKSKKNRDVNLTFPLLESNHA